MFCTKVKHKVQRITETTIFLAIILHQKTNDFCSVSHLILFQFVLEESTSTQMPASRSYDLKTETSVCLHFSNANWNFVTQRFRRFSFYEKISIKKNIHYIWLDKNPLLKADFSFRRLKRIFSQQRFREVMSAFRDYEWTLFTKGNVWSYLSTGGELSRWSRLEFFVQTEMENELRLEIFHSFLSRPLICRLCRYFTSCGL